MQYLQAVTEFFISTWLWHFTFGWAQVISSCIFLFFLLNILVRLSWLQSALLALMSHVTVSLLFSGFVSLIIHTCEPDMVAMDKYMVVYTNMYQVIFSFCALYGVLLLLFFKMFNYAYPLPMMRVCTAVILSVIASACISPMLIQV